MDLNRTFVKLVEAKNPQQIWFCFHFLGGTASAYFPWIKLLPNNISLYALQLPGRDNRIDEPFILRVQDAVSEIVESFSLSNKSFNSFVFFGHSMGAILAYESLLALRSIIDITRGLLVVSACKAPHTIKKTFETYLLNDNDFIRELKLYGGTPGVILQDRVLLELFLPRLRADTELLETYERQYPCVLDMPILAMGGSSDRIVPVEDLVCWNKYTNNNFTYKLFDGEHFYLKTSMHSIIDEILYTKSKNSKAGNL